MIDEKDARALAAWLRRIGAPTISLPAADRLAALYSKALAASDAVEGSKLEPVARRFRAACLDVAIVAMGQARDQLHHEGGGDGAAR